MGQEKPNFLVQEFQPAKDIDLTCLKTFLIKTATCLQVGLMSWDWLVDPIARFDFPRSSLFHEVSSDEQQQRGALPASTRSRWRQNALQAPLQVLSRIAGWDGFFFLPEVFDVLLGTPGVSSDLFSQQKNWEFKLKYLEKFHQQ